MSIFATDLAKLLEDRRLFGWRNTDTRITDRDLGAMVCLVCRDADPASRLGGKLNGIGKEVEKDLFDLPLITDVFTESVVNVHVKRNSVLHGALSHKCPCVVDG